MTVTSLAFFIFLTVGGMVFYIIPKKWQWIVLLCMSILFCYMSVVNYTIVFLIFSTIIAYIAGLLFERDKVDIFDRHKKWITAIAVVAVALNIIVWFLCKGSSFWIFGSKVLNRFIPNFPILSALPITGAIGMGYYTAQVIGYIMDCYWGNIKPQRNFFKLFLFVSFFPQLTVGPISSYLQLESLYEKHFFSYQNLCFGCQRIIWGVLKKIVISERLGIIVRNIWDNLAAYDGLWPWIAVFLFPLQLYTDFSGCMDIVLGASELFGIHLKENFRSPFFSRTTQEFWQRWHITLGVWAKNYVYYPILKSRFIQSIGIWSRKHFSKRIARLIPWAFGMGVLWFIIGFWHGSLTLILGVSAWQWIILVTGELFSPVSKKIVQTLHINVKSFSWHLMQSIRTYMLYALGSVFFSAKGLKAALSQYIFLVQQVKNINPWILFDGSITGLGVTFGDVNIIILGIGLLIVVAYLREKYGYARNWIKMQILPFRWFIWFFLVAIVLVYGFYGPGYDASAFIYEDF